MGIAGQLTGTALRCRHQHYIIPHHYASTRSLTAMEFDAIACGLMQTPAWLSLCQHPHAAPEPAVLPAGATSCSPLSAWAQCGGQSGDCAPYCYDVAWSDR